MITELATFHIATPTNLSDPSSATTSTIHTFLSAILASDGAHAAFIGQPVEDPNMVAMFIDWDSVGAHERFLSSPTHGSIAAPLLDILSPTAPPPRILHLPQIPHDLFVYPTEPHITEVVLLYFAASITPSAAAAVRTKMLGVQDTLKESEAMGVCGNWQDEGDEGVLYKGEMCRVWVSVVVWESVEAHLSFKGRPANVEVIKGLEGLREMEVFHAKMVKA